MENDQKTNSSGENVNNVSPVQNTESDTINKATGISVNEMPNESSDSQASENSGDKKFFFEKYISLFHLIMASPLIIVAILIIYKILLILICTTKYGKYMAVMNVSFFLVIYTAIHIFIAYLIGRDIKRADNQLKQSFYARPIIRYFIFAPLICVFSWFYIMAYGISKIGKTGVQNFYKLKITKAVPIIITAVSYVLFLITDSVDVTETVAVCYGGYECVNTGDAFTQEQDSCETSILYYEKSCTKYLMGEGCAKAGLCYDMNFNDPVKAQKFYKKACDRHVNEACKLYITP